MENRQTENAAVGAMDGPGPHLTGLAVASMLGAIPGLVYQAGT